MGNCFPNPLIPPSAAGSRPDPDAGRRNWCPWSGEEPSAPATILVIGCSGHARVALDIIAEEGRHRVMGLIDSYKPIGTELLGYEVVGREEDVRTMIDAGICDGVLVAIGDNWVRGELVGRLRELVPRIRFVTAVHPSARIARGVSIGCGTVVMAGTVVNTGSRIGEFCILNTASSLDHDCTMEDFSSLAPRAVTGGGVRIGTFSAIAIGATVSHEISIGKHSIVGAGATVVRDVPDCVVAYGTPARVIRERKPGDPYLGGQSTKSRADSLPACSPRLVTTTKSLTLIPPTSSDWQAYLDRTEHDFFHSAAYHLVSEEFGGGTAWLAIFGHPEKFVAWPYILREIAAPDRNSASTLRDVGCVYGYTGPLSHGTERDEAFQGAAWTAILETWRSQGAISVFTRCHPLLNNYTWLRRKNGEDGTSAPDEESDAMGRTIAIDLARPQDKIWETYSRQLRQALRRCATLGLISTIDEDWTGIEDLTRLYYQTMRRNNAAAFYYFPAEYFRRLKEALGCHGKLIITRCGGTVGAAGLLIEYGGIATMHLLASDERFSTVSPAKLLIHDAQIWAQRRGNRYLHLGGGRAGRDEDSLFRFKRMFSDLAFPFRTGRWILDAEAYAFLTEERRRNAIALGRGGLVAKYFPSYRAPFLAAAGTESISIPAASRESPAPVSQDPDRSAERGAGPWERNAGDIHLDSGPVSTRLSAETVRPTETPARLSTVSQ